MNLKKFHNRLFGRKKGRSKKKINLDIYNELIENYKFTNLESNKRYILDIGTGYGETSIYLAKHYKKINIISCEKYINGNLSLLSKIKNNKIKNILIYPGNVNDILDTNKKNKYFDKVWIFFPDPWPKKKHFKRRLISDDFLKKLHMFIKRDGEIYIATDSTSYSRSIISTIYKNKNIFHWHNQKEPHLSIKDYFNLETKYYKKAIISERKPSLFILRKI